MNLLYKSTRNSDKTVTASQAILKGLADDGGLFVPVSVPKLDVTMDELKDMSYQETAYAVMKQFFTDFTEEELKHCINSAYDSKFDTEVIAPLVKVGDTYHLELFHGATISFFTWFFLAEVIIRCGRIESAISLNAIVAPWNSSR